MNCQYCDKEIDDNLKYVAFTSENNPIYFKICDACLKQKWLDYKASLKENIGGEIKG